MEYVGIPSVMVICYLVAELLKVLTNKNEIVKKLIPIFVGMFGGIITGITFVIYPNILCVNNILEAIAAGIISGLA